MVMTFCHIRSSISSFYGGELEQISFYQLHICQVVLGISHDQTTFFHPDPELSLCKKGGKVVDSTGVDCEITEAEVSTKGSIQEQEVPAS
ncbi:hypothetical protein P3L10_005768 [Capsicum annuum]